MKEGGISFVKIFSFLIFPAVFISIFLFVNIQMDKYNYFLYIYGEEVAPGAKALIKVISRDGEFVASPEMYINGRKTETNLIDLRPDMKEISVKVGKSEQIFPVKYSELEKLRIPPSKYLQLSEKEVETVPSPAKAGTRTVYLLPDRFRAVSEYETRVHLFCVENDLPCKDGAVSVNGIQKVLDNGYLNFTTIFTHEKNVNLSFSDGSSVTAKIPYSGKMFMIYSGSDGITVSSLSDVRNVHIDCYSRNKWIGTDIISVYHTGVKLPEVYSRCDHIQVSFNSSSPGTTYLSYSNVPELLGDVNDAYYSGLGRSFNSFTQNARQSFIKSYNASFFKPLSLIFSGEVLEKDFLKEKNSRLNFYWWMILLFSLAGLFTFIVTVLKKMKVVEGVDGELISRSMASQRMMLAGAVVIYVSFLTMLLYLLRNLA